MLLSNAACIYLEDDLDQVGKMGRVTTVSALLHILMSDLIFQKYNDVFYCHIRPSTCIIPVLEAGP
jgi:hypothetical protein